VAVFARCAPPSSAIRIVSAARASSTAWIEIRDHAEILSRNTVYESCTFLKAADGVMLGIDGLGEQKQKAAKAPHARACRGMHDFFSRLKFSSPQKRDRSNMPAGPFVIR
jgi:hypothetical protein